ncbi:FAD-binding oxidoreductase [Mycobacteroides abscessus]|nr:FAD-binding oxidoreductase [Mycobacteroides abscessus]QCO28683.1 FAD-binding oxidoreductase [Mycobacteroides abscessus subsp. massiliense]AWG62059.1 FAD-binding oxidoreductase [Mycobacteroides abscessus]AWG71763.1 FAD-binding oxidoreductase [Mycobacteroides abscessus]PVA65814.1 FAD-binding oxidoreductase [Mycobacteroides abscessus]
MDPRSRPALMTRRTVLSAGAMLTLGSASLIGCSPVLPHEVPAGARWEELRRSLSGALVVRGDAAMDESGRAFNPLFDVNHPGAVAFCASDQDVARCVEFATSARLPIAARSGGHSYAGYCVPNDGLVVDLARMAAVSVTGTRAVVGAGARLIDVYAGIAGAGRMLAGGSCPTVGIAGLTLGGGVGVLTRRFGLTCDQLISARVVTADGKIRVVSADTEPDLFWAIRGAGGGNFCIATELVFETAASTDLTVFTLDYGAGEMSTIVHRWLTFMTGAPDELWTTLHAIGGAIPQCRIVGCVAQGVNSQDVIESLRSEIGVRAADPFIAEMTFLDAMKFMGGCTTLTVAQCHPSWTGTGSGQLKREAFVASSRMVPHPDVDTARIETLLAGKPGLTFIFDSLGGVVRRISSDATAFPHRQAVACIQIYHGVGTDPVVAHERVSQARDGLGDICGPAAYVNYIDPGMPDWATAYYGDNLPRLRGIAATYDPKGVFRFAQAVQP